MQSFTRTLKKLTLTTLFALAGTFVVGTTLATAQDRSFGDVQILATVPFPRAFRKE